jgi:hypothetical protein
MQQQQKLLLFYKKKFKKTKEKLEAQTIQTPQH